jgi:hypothetical protein
MGRRRNHSKDASFDTKKENENAVIFFAVRNIITIFAHNLKSIKS